MDAVASGRRRASRRFCPGSVHLLFDNIRALADASCEEFEFFRHGRANFPVAEVFEHFARGAFHLLPPPDLVGQYVIHASNGLKGFHSVSGKQSKFSEQSNTSKKGASKSQGKPCPGANYKYIPDILEVNRKVGLPDAATR